MGEREAELVTEFRSAKTEPTQYDYWVCDNCHRTYPVDIPQYPVKIQQRSERIYGTAEMYRPVERLIICGICARQFNRND